MKTNWNLNSSSNKLKLKRKLGPESDEEAKRDVAMKTNRNFNSSNKLKSKRDLPPESDDEARKEELSRYIDDDSDSEKFEVPDYEPQQYRDGRMQMHTGVPIVCVRYNSSDPDQPDPDLYDDMLLYLSKLAITFYNMREGTSFCGVKLLVGTEDGFLHSNIYITFQAFSSISRRKNVGVPRTFQTKIIVYHPSTRPNFKIMFVRIKPVHNKSKRHRRPFKSVRKASVCRKRLTQVIQTYDSQLDSQYGLAHFLSQYALVSYFFHMLSEDVAKHDIESVKVLKLVKPVAEVPTYLITFEAPLHTETETEEKYFEVFQTEIRMLTLFPTTTIELKSEAR